MEELLSLPTPVLVAIGVVVVVQIVLEVYAIIDIIRRPADRITGGNKLLWILLVLFVNLIGAVVYLVFGRMKAPAADVASAVPIAERGANAADMLYGTRDAFTSGSAPASNAGTGDVS